MTIVSLNMNQRLLIRFVVLCYPAGGLAAEEPGHQDEGESTQCDTDAEETTIRYWKLHPRASEEPALETPRRPGTYWPLAIPNHRRALTTHTHTPLLMTPAFCQRYETSKMWISTVQEEPHPRSLFPFLVSTRRGRSRISCESDPIRLNITLQVEGEQSHVMLNTTSVHVRKKPKPRSWEVHHGSSCCVYFRRMLQ